jgi:hypothetical protein
MYYIYVYLDSRKKGSYSYGEFHFEYEPFYIGKGVNDRYLSHLRVASGSRKGKNNLIISKIKSIINDGFEPKILKVIENLTKENYDSYEVLVIKLIGKLCDGLGPLLNTTDGGDGGITWVGEHHNKGKKLEEIVGEERAIELKYNLSKISSERIGYKNSNFGNRGELNPMYGKKATEETKSIMRKNALYQFSKYSDEEIQLIVNNMNNARKAKPEEVKQKWYDKQSNTMKVKYEGGELFTEDHRQKLKDTNYRKLNKGSDELKLADDTKQKISNKLKGRVFTQDHKDKLRKCIKFEEFEKVIINLVDNKVVKTITAYRKYAKENPKLKLSSVPEKSYKNYGWGGWRKYGL